MTRRLYALGAIGAVGGAFLALVALALAGGLLIDGGAATDGSRTLVSSETVVLYLYVIAGGSVGGAVIALVTASLSKAAHPNEPRFGAAFVAVVGAAIGAIIAYATVRSSLGLTGNITADVATIGAFRLVVAVIVAGALGGATTAIAAERLSRPEVLGLAGEAWPADRSAFLRASTPAVLIPAIAVIVIAALVIGVSQVLLAGNNAAAVIVAVALAALILGGGAMLTAQPRPGRDEGNQT